MPPQKPVCPYCGANLFPHEVTNGECSSCGRRLAAAVTEEPTRTEPPPRTDQPLTLPGLPPPEAFATLRQGVNLVRWGVGLGLAFGALASVCPGIAMNLKERGDARVVLALGLFGGVFQVVSALVVLLGVCFCCAVPRGCDAWKWARWLFVCLLLAPVFVLAGVFLPLLAGVEKGAAFLANVRPALGVGLAVLVSMVLFGSFFFFLALAALARFFGDPKLDKGFTTYFLVWLLAFFVAGLFGLVVFAIDAGPALPDVQGKVPRAWTDDPNGEFGDLSRNAILSTLTAMNWGGLAVGAPLAVWLLVLLTRLHRLIPTPSRPEALPLDPPPNRWG